jgi:hypothetical protein
MSKESKAILVVAMALAAASMAFGQERVQRRPPAVASQTKAQPTDWDGSVFVLDGMPMLLTLHHDTEVGTNNPIDIYEFVIEMQVMNSDGNLEPVGLQFHNFYTAKAQDPRNAFNPHNARDCKIWNSKIAVALQKRKKDRNPKHKPWPYIEMVTNSNARVVETNEHGQVWWSDDVECWGAMDRFPPF